MGIIDIIFGKRCVHDDHISDTIKDKFYICKDGTFANETDVITCSKCKRYYFINRGRVKQDMTHGMYIQECGDVNKG
jgi:hypothetical protein